MDALLTALIGCLLGEIGDKGQLLALALATRFERNGPVLLGIAVAALASAVIGALAGAVLAPMLGSDARLLFLSLALLFLGAGMLWPTRPPDPLAGWRIGPFLTAALGLFILSFGDGSQFLILGIATRTGDPVMAALGGAVGIGAAMAPVVIWRDDLLKRVPLRALRIGGAVIPLGIGLILAVKALGLS